jgi:hypothetical protein
LSSGGVLFVFSFSSLIACITHLHTTRAVLPQVRSGSRDAVDNKERKG